MAKKDETPGFDPAKYVYDQHPDVVELHRLRETVKEKDKKEKDLVKRLSIAERRMEQALAISHPKQPAKLKTKKIRGTRTATPVLMASDWHVEEEIKADRVNGRNSFDLNEAERRSRNFWDGSAWLINWMRNPLKRQIPFSCKKAVLWLGGDMITAYLHEENEETNLLAPLEAIMFAQRLIIEGIDYLLEECDLEELLVVCNYGNHGRLHKRKRFKSAAKNNFEWLMYHTIAQHYAKDERLKFQIASGAHVYASVESHLIRFVHGDDWMYQGGVGGLSVPVLRGVGRLDQGMEAGRKVTLTVMGHFHSLLDLGSAIVNGCLCGYNEYALSKSFSFEPPQQAFFLMDEKHGKCLTTPIWVESPPT